MRKPGDDLARFLARTSAGVGEEAMMRAPNRPVANPVA
jgi:hypothetical protein